MRVCYILAILLLDASGENGECVADPSGIRQCDAGTDATSLLQQRNVKLAERGQDELVAEGSKWFFGGSDQNRTSVQKEPDDRIWLIENVKAVGKYINVQGGSTSNQAQIQIYQCTATCQWGDYQWRIKETGDDTGIYNIESVKAVGKYLNVEGGGTHNEAKVQLYDNPQVVDTQWRIKKIRGLADAFYIENIKAVQQGWSQKVLNVQAGWTHNGAKVQLYDNPQYAESQWRIKNLQGQTWPAPIPCEMGSWSWWSPCSATCGPGGSRFRSRKVTSPAKYGGTCNQPTKESEKCNTKPCPIHIQNVATVKLCGKVKSAVDNKPVPGARVRLQGSEKKSDGQGKFCFEDAVTLVDGKPQKVTLTATKEGWSDQTQTVEVSKTTGEVVVAMSPKLNSGQWRIVMTWGATNKKPLDLDAHTKFGPGRTCKVDYNAKGKDRVCSNGMRGHLDLDHCWIGSRKKGGCSDESDEGKPETTTLDASKCKGDCTISFRVHNWLASTHKDKATLAESEAVVRVYNGDGDAAIATYELGKDGKVDGYNWYVFSVDTATNKLSDCSSASECGF